MAVRFDKFTTKAQEAVQRAHDLAADAGNPQLDALHVLAALLAETDGIIRPVLEKIGAAHGKTASQVSLRWLAQQGLIVIPGSGKPERQAENFAVLDFALSAAEMAEIATLKRPDGRVVNPPHAPKWDV